jgi:hypothetical protein
MQAVARWGNFFNQELYGPPTNLPWGIAIQCSHRIVQYACPAGSDPNATLGEHFQPLFLYESLSGLLGVLALMFLARRFGRRLRTGDLLAVFFIWYGVVRFALETLRADNWTFFGVPMAQIFSTIFIVLGIAILVIRRLRGAPTFLVADSAAKVAALEPVGVPGEGGMDADGATDLVDDAAAAAAESEARDGAGEPDEPDGPGGPDGDDDDLTSLLALKGEGAAEEAGADKPTTEAPAVDAPAGDAPGAVLPASPSPFMDEADVPPQPPTPTPPTDPKPGA